GYIMLVNNEDNYSVSKLYLDKHLKPLRGEYALNSDGGTWRLCSGTMVTPQEHGFGPLYLSAGESNVEAMTHAINPFAPASPHVAKGLSGLGRWSAENAVPLNKHAFPGKTVVLVGEDASDATGGQLVLYKSDVVGDLDNGSIYMLRRKDGVQQETAMQTGKTYAAPAEAVRLCNGVLPEGRAAVMHEYARLAASGRIEFVTFHQSYSYEEFVEGLRPVQSEGATAGFGLQPEMGTLRRVALRAEKSAGTVSVHGKEPFSVGERTIYKMSIGEAGDPGQNELFDDAIDGGYALIGWATIDWSDDRYRDVKQIIERYREAEAGLGLKEPTADSGRVQQIDYFRNRMKKGDLIIVSKGNSLFRAIGEVTGDYAYSPREGSNYAHRRAVNWLWVDHDGVPREEIYAKSMTQWSIYKLNRAHLNIAALERYINSGSSEGGGEPEPFVLIIDEINRANISKVFGELITLLEPDKRIGQPNELKVRLPYSRDLFGLPANLHIIGTMNTADRSIALLDTALRRRFEFRELMPDASTLRDASKASGIPLENLLRMLNERIEYMFDREHQIGHAYFIGCASREDVDKVMRDRIIPLLTEYFYSDWTKVAAVLGDAEGAGNFLDRKALVPPTGINGDDGGEPRYRWSVKPVFAAGCYNQFQ
ncbi:MAG: hypothetical protein EOP84_05445, partial [Verrucomicrobiaceae bacterium]